MIPADNCAANSVRSWPRGLSNPEVLTAPVLRQLACFIDYARAVLAGCCVAQGIASLKRQARGLFPVGAGGRM